MAVLMVNPAHAQFGMPWSRVPEIVVISADGGDPRLGLVDDAVSFWNKTLEDMGLGRLGPVKRIVLPVPEAALQSLSRSVVSGPRPVDVPHAFRGLPGDLTILLADSDFVSFAGPFDPDRKRIVGIRRTQGPAADR
jgi:hypothetical protein